MALAVEADLIVRSGGNESYLQLFDRDGDGLSDPDLVAAAIAWGEAIVFSKLSASHPGVDFETPGPVPYLIIDLVARLAIGYAEDLSITLRNIKREKGTGFKASAMADLEAIATNDLAQIPDITPQPFASGASYVHAPAPVYGAVAGTPSSDPDGGGYSGF